MRLTPAQAAQLVHLASGKSLPKSQIPKRVLQALEEHGNCVKFEKSGASYVVRGLPGQVQAFAKRHWGISDLAAFAQASPDARSRELLSAISEDSKTLPTNPLKGIFIRTFGQCFHGDSALGVTPFGTAILITLDVLPQLRLETPLIVAVENVECLWKFERMISHFPVLQAKQFTLILRWNWGQAWRKWLDSWKGGLFYIPDYDPAGLQIFSTEVLPFFPCARLLVPTDLKRFLNNGKRERFLEQEHCLPVDSENAQVAELCALFKQVRKGLDQEALLSL
ncbi:MAG: hypothetical protein JWM68_5668 [Verrucomicrobiales bacterium]|nr:hypothetical protein [Verrucomicrobiales bacterium]